MKPDLVFTQNRKDAHQDHRLIAEMTWNTFRDQLVLEYEIPKYDGDLGQPNFFVPLDKEAYSNKVEYLMKAFQSQRNKRWFEPENYRPHAAAGDGVQLAQLIRGGFYGRKFVL